MSVQVDERAISPAGRLRPESCAAMSAALDEPVAGTAPVAQSWLAVEVAGPWSAKVLQDAARPWLIELDQQAKAHGVSVIAVRRPGRSGRAVGPGARALLACTVPGRTALAEIEVAGPQELCGLDLAGLAVGQLPARARPIADNVLLVCTNSKRDVCCAVAGRALAEALDRARPGRVWECSHLGGHRFAPTALVLPSGYAYARLTVPAALRLLDAEPSAAPQEEGCRGRSTWDRQGQLAEVEARRLLGESGQTFDADGLTVQSTAPDVRTVVTSTGLQVPVRIGESPASPARSISCGAEPVSPPVLTAQSVGPVRN